MTEATWGWARIVSVAVPVAALGMTLGWASVPLSARGPARAPVTTAVGTPIPARLSSAAPPSTPPPSTDPSSTTPSTTPSTTAPRVDARSTMQHGPATAPVDSSIMSAPAARTARLVTAGDPVSLAIDGRGDPRLSERPENGVVQLDADGRATYVPDDGFVGDDMFALERCSSSGCEPTVVDVVVLPESTSRFVSSPVRRLLDTRSVPPGTTGPVVSVALPELVAAEAVVLSVTALAADRSGSVAIDGGVRPVTAVTVAGPGGADTNLVVVALSGGTNSISIVDGTGGHLVIDLIGHFSSTTGSPSGRFVRIEPVRATHVVTAEDGRDATISVNGLPGIPGREVGAVLARVTADVGPNGGNVRLGPGQGGFDQMLMWGPPRSEDVLRGGIVLLSPDADGVFSLRYEGGAVIDVDIIGYFTNDDAPDSTAGLYVPLDRTQTVVSRIPVGEHVVGEIPDFASAAFVNVTTGSATTAGSIVTAGRYADGGSVGIVISSASEVDVRLDVLGVFLGAGVP